MSNEQFHLLVSKKFSGEASENEIKELEQMLSADTSLLEEYRSLQKFWEEHETPNNLFVEESLQKVLGRLALNNEESSVIEFQSAPRRQWLRWSAVAASVLLLITAGFFWFTRSSSSENITDLASMEQKQNSKGVKSIIELSDGSKVWLNADSKIQYPPSFAGNTREIYLDGEAFFDVAKNADKPFIIHLANGTVRVLGTSFNVRAYGNEKVVETSVATGKVAFIPKYIKTKKKQDTVFITPNNKVRYIFNEEKIQLAATQVIEDKAWTEGRLIFKAMTLEEIAVELERNFGKKVIFLDEEAKEYVLTGSFQNNTLEEIMYYLSLSKTKKIYYKINSDELLIAIDSSKL